MEADMTTENSEKRLHGLSAWLRWIGARAKRLIVLVAGLAVVGAGLAMLVLPGPGVLVVVVGLAVLATEFAWAERALDKTRARASAATNKLTGSRLGQFTFGLSATALVIGGGVAAALSDKYRTIGITTIVAGLCAAAVLFPAVRRWIERPAPDQ
jgi:uncharacterized protein (TIGR02611 family)